MITRLGAVSRDQAGGEQVVRAEEPARFGHLFAETPELGVRQPRGNRISRLGPDKRPDDECEADNERKPFIPPSNLVRVDIHVLMVLEILCIAGC